MKEWYCREILAWSIDGKEAWQRCHKKKIWRVLKKVFDVIVFGIVIIWLNEKRQKKLDIQRWQEEIDDYRGWDEKEAMYRIVGNIKRLNREKSLIIYLSSCYLIGADLMHANLYLAQIQSNFISTAGYRSKGSRSNNR